MLWTRGRISWPVVISMLFTTLIIVLTDFAWRTVEMPVAALALCGAVLLLIGNSAIFVLAARSANSPP